MPLLFGNDRTHIATLDAKTLRFLRAETTADLQSWLGGLPETRRRLLALRDAIDDRLTNLTIHPR